MANLVAVARARGTAWAEQSAATLSGDCRWPDDDRILARLAALDVADLRGGAELVREWIAAAGERWRERRAG